ncbi:MAG: DUF4296 domain-containing protein [Bacteroidales bacterium]|nr:DUF4296 domain-containing protein [Bacteroidales bacterium]
MNKILPVTALCLIFILSCKNREKKELIPLKTFSRIMYEVYLADGLLSSPGIRNQYNARDSVANYRDIAENHGYTIETLNSTMKYYFTKKPKKFIKIYDNTIAMLTEMELRLEDEMVTEFSGAGGMWKGQTAYHFSGPPDTARISFDHIFHTPGIYSIRFTVTLHPADQSVNPRLTACICPVDSLSDREFEYFSGPGYLKDGQPHTYDFPIRISGSLPVLFRGKLLDFENNPGRHQRYGMVENISFTLSSSIL